MNKIENIKYVCTYCHKELKSNEIENIKEIKSNLFYTCPFCKRRIINKI